jgi:RimJ/RimL family protein N-acetyltransferase
MAIYTGKNYATMDVHIGAPDVDAWHQRPIADDVIGSVRHWFNAALARDDVLYFGVFWSGQPVGQILLHDMHAQTSLVAYHLFSPADRGRGVGTHALRLLQDVVTTTTLRQLIIITSRDNTASQRIAQKCGFVLAGAPREDPVHGIRFVWNASRKM